MVCSLVWPRAGSLRDRRICLPPGPHLLLRSARHGRVRAMPAASSCNLAAVTDNLLPRAQKLTLGPSKSVMFAGRSARRDGRFLEYH